VTKPAQIHRGRSRASAQRIQHALSLLKETDLSIEEIARHSGYTDPDYFARVVRKTVGVSPTEFRRQ